PVADVEPVADLHDVLRHLGLDGRSLREGGLVDRDRARERGLAARLRRPPVDAEPAGLAGVELDAEAARRSLAREAEVARRERLHAVEMAELERRVLRLEEPEVGADGDALSGRRAAAPALGVGLERLLGLLGLLLIGARRPGDDERHQEDARRSK